MNDLDDLRAALESPPGFTARPLDIYAAMAAGRRIRRRRRLATVAAAGVVVIALLAGGHQWVSQPETGGRGGPQVAGAPAPADRLGDVIRTGLAAGDGEWVLYARPIDEPSLPGVTFGVMLGRTPAAGAEPADVVLTNETDGSDRSPGFHAVYGGTVVDGMPTPAFGYYVGPAARITARIGGRTVTAGQAAWSEDPSVVVFWFRPGAGTIGTPTAYDSSGATLPRGRAGVAVG